VLLDLSSLHVFIIRIDTFTPGGDARKAKPSIGFRARRCVEQSLRRGIGAVGLRGKVLDADAFVNKIECSSTNSVERVPG